MATVHMTYNEVSNNFAAVLEDICKGVEVVVEQDHRLSQSFAGSGHFEEPEDFAIHE